MDKKRLLITISFSFSIRYLYRTGLLNKLRDFVTPVIAITWNETSLIKELQDDGFEVYLIEESKKGNQYSNIRTKIDYWFHGFMVKSISKKVQEKYLNQYLPTKQIIRRKAREQYNLAKFYIPNYRSKLFIQEQSLLQHDTNYQNMLQLVDDLNIDAVFTVTPFHTQEDVLLRACKQKGKFMITSILSFDNLTKRGWIPVEYDVYLVWNKYNKQEAIKYYPSSASNKNVHIVGAAQFDFYFDNNNLLAKDEWKNLVGIPAEERQIILYGGGPQRLFPNEPQYLQHILNAIDKGEITGNPLVLFRCHPIDRIERWKNLIGNHPNLIYDISWTGKETLQSTNISRDDVKKLCSTLAYTDVHINLCSTLTVDGSAYNKPQIGPCYDEVNASKQHLLQDMYLQDHFKPIVESKGLLLAKSKKELVQFINDTLKDPSKYINKSKKILQEIISFDDGKCTDRVASVIKESLR